MANNVDTLMMYAAYHKDQQAEILEWLQALRGLYNMLRNNPQLDPRTGQFLLEGQPPSEKAVTKKSINASELQSELDYDADLLQGDLKCALRWGQQLDLRSQDRGVYIMNSTKLKDWLLSERNGILLINGNEPELDQNIHATSFLSAHLINSVCATKKNMICIYWFCSLHRNARKDPHATVAAIVLSLICQLLSRCKRFDLSFFHRRHLHGVREGDLDIICNTLDELILQLPKRTVLFLVLDCLSFLEDAQRRADVQYLVGRLCQVARTPGKAVFKLLINNAGGRFRAGSEIEKEDTLMVPQSVDGDGAGFSRLMWNLRIEQQVKELASRSRENSRRRDGSGARDGSVA